MKYGIIDKIGSTGVDDGATKAEQLIKIRSRAEWIRSLLK